MQLEDYLNKYQTLKNIKRFNMETTLHTQNLCDHGFNVGTLFYLLCKEVGLRVEADALFVVMNHDFAEVFTGDLNRLIKDKNEHTIQAWKTIEECGLPYRLRGWTDQAIKETMSERHYVLFELADCIDAFLYCQWEVGKGNGCLREASYAYRNKILDINKVHDGEFTKIIKEIKGL